MAWHEGVPGSVDVGSGTQQASQDLSCEATNGRSYRPIPLEAVADLQPEFASGFLLTVSSQLLTSTPASRHRSRQRLAHGIPM
ncbi:hypothetical protein AX27061_3839 [Achromobacter xylosoxidans NBRC 15126 = ATCC 27061]|nr:hypothetical protein AX27061_3839 [Achromobacter xylosoxidans NBRC 15126 = ATCC 27061]